VRSRAARPGAGGQRGAGRRRRGAAGVAGPRARAASSKAYDAWLAALPADAGPVEALTQPAAVERFDAATFTWRGGSNAVDNPDVRVERLVDGVWQPYADMSGEVQTLVDFPNGVQGVADTHTGRQEWRWTASFEAFTGFPARFGATPAGAYRFVVDGVSRVSGASEPYALTSEPFEVRPWSGLQVADPVVDGRGDVSFASSVAYPRSYASAFRTIKDDGRTTICRTCSFRPWAQVGSVASAVVTVTRADGSVERVPASLSDGRWTASTALRPGDRAVLAPGDVRDAAGNGNGAELVLAG
jgi:hypothetical protein